MFTHVYRFSLFLHQFQFSLIVGMKTHFTVVITVIIIIIHPWAAVEVERVFL